jgi:hypothetical protein
MAVVLLAPEATPPMHLVCPHCKNPIELVEAAVPDEIFCPACGSSFRLERQAPTCSNPAAGRRDLSRFRVLDVVGTVYKARDRLYDRMAAANGPRAGNLPGGQELDRFLRDPRSVAQLRHPVIVPVHEVGRDGDVRTSVQATEESHHEKERAKRQENCYRSAPRPCTSAGARGARSPQATGEGPAQRLPALQPRQGHTRPR